MDGVNCLRSADLVFSQFGLVKFIDYPSSCPFFSVKLWEVSRESLELGFERKARSVLQFGKYSFWQLERGIFVFSFVYTFA